MQSICLLILYILGICLSSLAKKLSLNQILKNEFNLILINGFGQSKLFKDKKSGLMHLVLFYTFFIIQIGLIELIIKGFIKGYEFPFGEAHKYFSLLQEWATFLMLLAVVYGFYRRYGEKLKRLQWKRDGKAAFVYIALCHFNLIDPAYIGIRNHYARSRTKSGIRSILWCHCTDCFPESEQRQELCCSTYFGGFIC